MPTIDLQGLAGRYHKVRQSLPGHVTLVAVSKTRSVEEIRALYDLGHRAFGENYPQELREKQAQLPPDIEWHFIGHLQTNKVKHIAPFVHLVHGADRIKLLDELDLRAAQCGRQQDVLLQVHIAREETKFGFSPTEVGAVMERIQQWPNLKVRGLMGMATNTQDKDRIASEFDQLASLYRRIRDGNAPAGFGILSMGMSADVELAVQAGSTLVRIGTALFGERV